MRKLILIAKNGNRTDLGKLHGADWREALKQAADEKWGRGPDAWHWDQRDGLDCAVGLDGVVLAAVEG